MRLKVRLMTHDYRHLAIALGRFTVGEGFAHSYISEIGEVEAPEVDTNDPLEMCAGGGGSQELSQAAESSTVNGKVVGSSILSMIYALGPFSSHNRHPVIGCE
jgi:hypothetical protein